MNLSPLAVSALATPSPLENLLALVFAAIAVFFVAMLLVSAVISALAPLASPLVSRLLHARRTRREKRKERVINRALAKIEAEESEVIRARIIARADINELFESSNTDSDLLAQEVAA